MASRRLAAAEQEGERGQAEHQGGCDRETGRHGRERRLEQRRGLGLIDIDLDDAPRLSLAVDDRHIGLDIKRRPVLLAGAVVERDVADAGFQDGGGLGAVLV
ncbi:hypothetical protein ACG873_17955 [Mesorhizobium sp. AaZ16]|uniref:hypothetical protein n=1 Tax=Mesorhizobium sp. AaZ16 TaxID=3402289 RepID=UPI00374F4D62